MPFISSIRKNYQPKKEGESLLDKVNITGGNAIITAGGYRIHMFTAVGDHELKIEAKDPSKAAEIAHLFTGETMEYLVIGGGGGSVPQGGGGGAGGYRTGADIVAALGPFSVTVGAGGNGSPSWQGQNSVFHTLTSTGGGHGGPYSNPGNPGGSGGGAGRDNSGKSRSTGIPGQGNPGGTNYGSGWTAAGGGGGAGGQGNESGGGNNGDGGRGPGGPGLTSSITGSPVARGGGGGGSSHAGPWVYQPGGDGGPGGGGRGQDYPWGDYSTPGATNTGGGAGGVVDYSRAGGPGIVVVRYIP